MGFIESYKHLEKLCGEILDDDRRISAYIDEMINTPRGAYLVPGWNDDLKQLKHYRWVRNQIAHELDCTESNMCQPDDTLWLDQFYSRIMNRTDPHALYAQATKPRPQPKTKQPRAPYSNPYTAPNTNTATSTYPRADYQGSTPPQKSGCLASVITILAAVTALLCVALKWL